MHKILKFIFGFKLYKFRTVPLSIIRSFSLHTQRLLMLYNFADSLRAGAYAPARKLSANLYVLLCVQWKTPDDGQRNCPKRVEFRSKNKFEKLVHLVFFIKSMFPWTLVTTRNITEHHNPNGHSQLVLIFSHVNSPILIPCRQISEHL